MEPRYGALDSRVRKNKHRDVKAPDNVVNRVPWCLCGYIGDRSALVPGALRLLNVHHHVGLIPDILKAVVITLLR
jgi:hypothetical protein